MIRVIVILLAGEYIKRVADVSICDPFEHTTVKCVYLQPKIAVIFNP
jgi:hypothetical protein